MNDIRKRKAIRDWNHWASHQALVLKTGEKGGVPLPGGIMSIEI